MHGSAPDGLLHERARLRAKRRLDSQIANEYIQTGMDSRELLVIDDEESIHAVLGDYLRHRGFKVYSALSGADGLDLLRHHADVPVVLTDIRIPGMDGLEVLREIKSHDPLTQVILMTAFGDKDLAIQALRLGADDFLEKPFRLDDLDKTLERSFDRQRLRSLSHRWTRLLERLPLGVIWCSADGTIQRISAAAHDLLACLSGSAVGKTLWPVPGFESAQSLFRATEASPSPQSVEVQACDRTYVLQCVDSLGEAGAAARAVLLTDVTEERLLQRELSALSRGLEAKVAERTRSLTAELEFSQGLLDAASVLVAVLDQDGKLLRLNRFAEELTRFTRDEVEHVFSSFARHPESPLSRVFDPRSNEELTNFVAELPTRDGTFRMVSWTMRNLPLQEGGGRRLIVGIDLTEQKQFEAALKTHNVQLEGIVASRSRELRQKDAQLIHAARLASLGEVAAGIAHEMKQPLNVISITADLIRLLHRNQTLTDDLLLANLEKIRRTVERMATTLNHLRGFTRIDSANFEPVRIADAVEGALSILGEQIRLDDIDIVREVPADLPVVQGELHQIEQVLVNLMQNARHAIEEKTAALEATGQTHRGRKLVTLRAGVRAEGREVFVEVIDTGIGLPEELKDRIFEPFFTTKEADRGTGLGLSISMNIVQAHGGTMEVQSVFGEGSTFRVVLPAGDEA